MSDCCRGICEQYERSLRARTGQAELAHRQRALELELELEGLRLASPGEPGWYWSVRDGRRLWVTELERDADPYAEPEDDEVQL